MGGSSHFANAVLHVPLYLMVYFILDTIQTLTKIKNSTFSYNIQKAKTNKVPLNELVCKVIKHILYYYEVFSVQ
jgi:hypothetical protein